MEFFFNAEHREIESKTINIVFFIKEQYIEVNSQLFKKIHLAFYFLFQQTSLPGSRQVFIFLLYISDFILLMLELNISNRE